MDERCYTATQPEPWVCSFFNYGLVRVFPFWRHFSQTLHLKSEGLHRPQCDPRDHGHRHIDLNSFPFSASTSTFSSSSFHLKGEPPDTCRVLFETSTVHGTAPPSAASRWAMSNVPNVKWSDLLDSTPIEYEQDWCVRFLDQISGIPAMEWASELWARSLLLNVSYLMFTAWCLIEIPLGSWQSQLVERRIRRGLEVNPMSCTNATRGPGLLARCSFVLMLLAVWNMLTNSYSPWVVLLLLVNRDRLAIRGPLWFFASSKHPVFFLHWIGE